LAGHIVTYVIDICHIYISVITVYKIELYFWFCGGTSLNTQEDFK
jgi:hypothetical protein